jgi:hypothetical protein
MNDKHGHHWITHDDREQRCSYCHATYLRLERLGQWQRYFVKPNGEVIRKPTSHGGAMTIPCRPV